MADEVKDGGAGKAETSGTPVQPHSADKEKTKVTSDVPEKAEGQMNPSSPGNTGTTPGTNAKVG